MVVKAQRQPSFGRPGPGGQIQSRVSVPAESRGFSGLKLAWWPTSRKLRDSPLHPPTPQGTTSAWSSLWLRPQE